MPPTMEVQPRIDHLGQRWAASGMPVYVSGITMVVLATTGNWQELANNAFLSLVLPQLSALVAFAVTSTLAIGGSLFGFIGLSSNKVANNISLAIGILTLAMPVVGLVQALIMLG